MPPLVAVSRGLRRSRVRNSPTSPLRPFERHKRVRRAADAPTSTWSHLLLSAPTPSSATSQLYHDVAAAAYTSPLTALPWHGPVTHTPAASTHHSQQHAVSASRSSTHRDHRGRGGVGSREIDSPASTPPHNRGGFDRTVVGAILFGSFLLLVTLSLISVTLIFCRKRNTVFALRQPLGSDRSTLCRCHYDVASAHCRCQPIRNEHAELIELRDFLLQGASDDDTDDSDTQRDGEERSLGRDESSLLWYHVIANPYCHAFPIGDDVVSNESSSAVVRVENNAMASDRTWPSAVTWPSATH